jgi:hypothetical protein
MTERQLMKNVIDWEWVRTPEHDMEFTLTVGTTERIAECKTTQSAVNLEIAVQLPKLSPDTVDFVIVKLGCGCEWKATSEAQGVNRICGLHFITDMIDDAEINLYAQENPNADD